MSDLLNQASLVMVPSGYKEDIVYSVVPTDGSGDLSFTRASNGTRVNSAGLVEVCPWNLVQQSEQIDNAAWIKFNCSITPNDAIAPNGTQTADKVVFSGSGHYFYQQTSFIGQATASIYVKGTAGETISIDNTQAITEPLITLTGEWQRITTTTTTSGSSVQGIALSTFQSATARTIYVWGGQVNAGTLKPYFPTTDRLNVPRLTYQNGGGGCPSLLLEKQSTNLLTYSEQFDNADWTKNNATVTANSTTSPDGTQNADTIVATSNFGRIERLITYTATSYTFSVFVKKATTSQIFAVAFSAAGAVDEFAVNINTGAISSQGSNVSLVTCQDFGTYWRVIGVSTRTASTETLRLFAGFPTNINAIIWGAQLEASSYATSYIPTTSSSATRVADVGTTSLSSAIVNASEGVLFLDFQPLITNDSYPVDFQLQYNGTNSVNGVTIYQQGNTPSITVRSGGSTIFSASLTATTAGTRNKIALAYKANDFAVYQNGVQKATQSSGVAPAALNELRLSDGTRNFSINQALVFPTRLTNAELASLTTL